MPINASRGRNALVRSDVPHASGRNASASTNPTSTNTIEVSTGHVKPISSAPTFGGKTSIGLARGVGLKRHRKILRDNVRGITKGDIRRMARRGGVKRIAANIYDSTREAMKQRLEAILQRLVVVVDTMQRKTVCVGDVVFVLNGMGKPIYGFGEADR